MKYDTVPIPPEWQVKCFHCERTDNLREYVRNIELKICRWCKGWQTRRERKLQSAVMSISFLKAIYDAPLPLIKFNLVKIPPTE